MGGLSLLDVQLRLGDRGSDANLTLALQRAHASHAAMAALAEKEQEVKAQLARLFSLLPPSLPPVDAMKASFGQPAPPAATPEPAPGPPPSRPRPWPSHGRSASARATAGALASPPALLQEALKEIETTGVAVRVCVCPHLSPCMPQPQPQPVG